MTRRPRPPSSVRPFIGPITARCERGAVQFRAMTHAPVRMNTRVCIFLHARDSAKHRKMHTCSAKNSTATLCYMSPALPATDYVGVGYHRRSLHLRANEACSSSAMSRAHAIRAQAFSKDLCTKPNIQAYFTEPWRYNVGQSLLFIVLNRLPT